MNKGGPWYGALPLSRFVGALTIRSKSGRLCRLTPTTEQVTILSALEGAPGVMPQQVVGPSNDRVIGPAPPASALTPAGTVVGPVGGRVVRPVAPAGPMVRPVSPASAELHGPADQVVRSPGDRVVRPVAQTGVAEPGAAGPVVRPVAPASAQTDGLAGRVVRPLAPSVCPDRSDGTVVRPVAPAAMVRSAQAGPTSLAKRTRPNNPQLVRPVDSRPSNDLLILKPRQIGSTTIISAYLFWKWYTATDPITIAILSHKQRSAVHILDIWRRFWNRLPNKMRRPLEIDNRNHIKLADSGAEVIAAGATDRGGIRSFSAHCIHLSEFAFSPDAEELLATSVGALAPGGKLIAESTANHYGDQLHQEVLKTQRGEGSWCFLFFPWYEHEAYRIDAPEEVDWTPEEDRLRHRHDLDDAQLWWRRSQIGRVGVDKFNREYPATIDDAYANRSGAWLDATDIQHVAPYRAEFTGYTYLADYHPDHRYAIGVDVGSGVGQDWTVAIVMDRFTFQPCAMWRHNRCSLRQAADAVLEMAQRYNALVLIESNNHGHALIAHMRRSGWTRFWLDAAGRDWITTTKSKALMWASLKTAIQDGSIYMIDDVTLGEMRQLIVDDQGRVTVPSSSLGHCDGAVAFALAYQCMQAVRLPRSTYLPNWVRAQRVDRIHNAGALADKRRY
jgi:hypothetical protein